MMYDKLLYGVAGATGASWVAWKTLFPWIGDDLKLIKAIGKVAKSANKDIVDQYYIIDKFEDKVKLHPHKPFVIYDGNIYSYQFIDHQANKVANIARKWGLEVGDAVVLFAANSAEYMWTFLGLSKLGVSVALINYNLQEKSLVHCIDAINAKIIIVGEGSDLLRAVNNCQDDLQHYDIYVQGCHRDELPPGLHSFDDLMMRSLPSPIHKNIRSNVTMASTFCYIYTSGTTGLPKPVYISQFRAMRLSILPNLFGAGNESIFYIFLPLYHTSGSMSWLGAIHLGATIVLRKKFSVTNFWKDVCQYNVTIIQYIGELCRYLLAQPKNPLENQHKLKILFGNGLRKDIWVKFQKRFNIPSIVEFFGATEGTGFAFQVSNKPGAIGRSSPFLKKMFPTTLSIVKYDYTTALPIRDKSGHCININPGETGLLISVIPPESINMPLYKASQEATDKKIIRNAFKDGDVHFNYGDTVYMDKDYFIYFHDRLGDTFRWKGENVSTTEVANVLTDVGCIHDANVYGVTVPGHDGRAGMAALTLVDITDLNDFHLKSIYKLCEKELPQYARPLFLRVLEKADLTATFKHRKLNLVKEGYDTVIVKDPLYFRDDKTQTYVPVTMDMVNTITKSKL